MERGGHHIRRAAALDNFPLVHDQHLIADVFHHPQMLGHVDIRDTLFFLQFQHQVNQLRAHRHIQRGKRLVGNDHFRSQNQRTRQTQTLFLAGSQHMRVVTFVIR